MLRGLLRREGLNRSIVSLLSHKPSRCRDEPEQSGHHGDDSFHGRQEHSKAVKEAVLDDPAKSVDPDKKTFTAIEEGRGPELCKIGGN